MDCTGEFPCLCSTCDSIGVCGFASSSVKYCDSFEKIEEEDEEED